MKTIDYFKLQAKNLYKDFKTQKNYFDSSLNDSFFEYEPKFFDVDALVTDFDIDEDHFSLMNAQHIIAKLAGYKKWTEMLKSSPARLHLAKLLLDNMHKISIEEWEDYISNVEEENDVDLDDEDRLDIFKTVFADVDGHQSYGYDYRLAKSNKVSPEKKEVKMMEKKSTIQITSLPLTANDQEEFIAEANKAFEYGLPRIEHENPKLVRNLWNAEQYIDEVLTLDKLPIDRNYALSLLNSFIGHKIIELAVQADTIE